MTINIIEDNIIDAFLEGTVQAIGHCCNCQKTMRSGVAKAIADEFPEAEYADKLGNSELGSFTSVNIGAVTPLLIYNLYGQFNYGSRTGGNGTRYVNYDAIYSALVRMRDHLTQFYTKVTKVGFPYKMASDRAGGDWTIIEAMISSVFKDTGIEVFIFKLPGT